MAGHNRWTQIKRLKAVKDAKKSSAYTKISKMITIAVKTGGGADPEYNFKLKAAIDKAKEARMPKDNIERAIEKGSGKNSEDDIKEVIFEGYLVAGVAVMVFAATENNNRTSNEIRTIFSKAGGSMGTSGSVAYIFDNKTALYPVIIEDEKLAKEIIEAIETLEEHDDVIEVISNFDIAENISL